MAVLLILAFLQAAPLVDAQEATDLYVDLSFMCPAKTTCPRVCSPTVADCPEDLKCNKELNETLCADGSCAVFCDPTLTSPCAETSKCSTVTCASINTYYDACVEDYGPWYEFASNCYGFELDDEIIYEESWDLSWSNPQYVWVCCWVAVMSIAIMHWCWYNHRICTVEGSTKLIQTLDQDGTTRTTTQTGYKRHPVGTLLYFLTKVTFFGWFALQIVCTWLYTNTEGDDKIMALKTFCVTWVAGFLWNLTLLWPFTIYSLFLRRCELHEATHVAIFQEMDATKVDEHKNHSFRLPVPIKAVVDILKGCAHTYFTLVFADPNCRPDNSKGKFAICPVQYNEDGTMYLLFLFRRHNFHKMTGTFEPGCWDLGKTFQELSPDGISAIDDSELALERIMMNDGSSEDVHVPAYRIDAKGLSAKEAQKRYRTVGPNVIEVPPPSFLGLLAEEIAKPFYLYQIYICWIWVCIDYLYATVTVWLIVLLTAVIISWFRFRGAQVLFAISSVSDTAEVLRDGEFCMLDQRLLVPGDIVKLREGDVHTDYLLLTGEVVADESALTGEATPQAKSPVDPHSREEYDPALHKKQTVSSGTTVMECEDALALVMKTSISTTKGELMRDVLVFRQHHLKFRKELPVAISFLTTYSSIIFLIVLFASSDELIIAWFLGMTAFSNSFPPLLPTTFIIPVGFAFERLARNGVACSDSDSIQIAGQVNIAFFDKTGTLTEQGLNFVSMRCSKSWNYGQWPSDKLNMAMCVCHSLTKSNKAGGALIGNPVDRAMFLASGAKLVAATGVTARVQAQNETQYEVIRRFDFDHTRMTQSSIVRRADGTVTLFVKGSGESISRLCRRDSIPANFEDRLRTYSQSGIYQIAVATKDLTDITPRNVGSLSRDKAEQDLTFEGVLNFANQLREDTPKVIKQLNDANIQSIMLTGDNLYTGIHIARQSGILEPERKVLLGVLNKSGGVVWRDENETEMEDPSVDKSARDRAIELSMSGEAWQVLLSTDKKYATSLAPFIRVFGRCSPRDKVSVVDTFTALGFTTMMSGDGGNDCGALRAAHIGLALSESDASIVAPLTSLKKDIADVLVVLKEGRCAMASTIAAYKYVIMYGNISSYCQLIMYYLAISFSDWMWLFTDVCWTVAFALTLPLAKPAEILSKSRPTASLLSLQVVGGIVGMVVMNFVFMSIALMVLYSEDWFQCRQWETDGIQAGSILSASDNYEISVVFLMVGTQLISSAAAFNFGYEHRRAWYQNYIFAALAIGYGAIHIVITLYPGSLSCLWRINCDNEHVVRGVLNAEPAPIGNLYNSTIMPMEFRLKLLGIMLANCICILAYEFFVVNGCWQRRRFAKELAEPAAKPYAPIPDDEV